MPNLEAAQKDSLREGAASPGMTRHLAFEEDGVQVLRSRVEPGTTSGWHHHGDHDVFGYVVSGTARFEGGSDGKDAISVGPGSFFHVPPHTVHREPNPSTDEGGEMILFLRGSGPMVVNPDSPDQS